MRSRARRDGRASPPLHRKLGGGTTKPAARRPKCTNTWLFDVLSQAPGLARPQFFNSDGEEIAFHEVVLPLTPKATPELLAARLDAPPPLRIAPSFRRESQLASCITCSTASIGRPWTSRSLPRAGFRRVRRRIVDNEVGLRVGLADPGWHEQTAEQPHLDCSPSVRPTAARVTNLEEPKGNGDISDYRQLPENI